MANVFKLGRYILLWVMIVYVLVHESVDGRSILKTVKEAKTNKAITKSIKGKDGEIIDCFDIYKQPAFDHPLLQNHTLQMKSSSYPSGMKNDDELEFKLIQTWHKNGKCPEGTVPIRRAHINYSRIPSQKHARKHNYKNGNFSTLAGDPSIGHEYAMVTTTGKDVYNGAAAILNIWKPTLGEVSEESISQIWVTAGDRGKVTFNSVESGWMFNYLVYGDYEPRWFLYWTSDNYESTGCYNIECPGFVQTNTKISLGSVFEPVSTYNGQQFDVPLAIFRDENLGNWWVKLNNVDVGYWPNSIFTSLNQGATILAWGGEIANKQSGGHHTTTQMGSGHFPSEGPRKASFFRNVSFVDAKNTNRVDPKKLQPVVSNPNCYDVHIVDNIDTDYGYHFYFGGPGLSKTCP